MSAVAAQQVPRQPPQLGRREPPLRHQLGGRPLNRLVLHRLRESGRVMIRGYSAFNSAILWCSRRVDSDARAAGGLG